MQWLKSKYGPAFNWNNKMKKKKIEHVIFNIFIMSRFQE